MVQWLADRLRDWLVERPTDRPTDQNSVHPATTINASRRTYELTKERMDGWIERERESENRKKKKKKTFVVTQKKVCHSWKNERRGNGKTIKFDSKRFFSQKKWHILINEIGRKERITSGNAWFNLFDLTKTCV